MSFADIETAYEEVAEAEVVRFDSLTVDGRAVGRQMLQEVLSSPKGMKQVVKNTCYSAREIAAELRNKDAHAVLWHPTKRRYYLASEFHKEAAQTLLKGSPWATTGRTKATPPRVFFKNAVVSNGGRFFLLPCPPKKVMYWRLHEKATLSKWS